MACRALNPILISDLIERSYKNVTGFSNNYPEGGSCLIQKQAGAVVITFLVNAIHNVVLHYFLCRERESAILSALEEAVFVLYSATLKKLKCFSYLSN